MLLPARTPALGRARRAGGAAAIGLGGTQISSDTAPGGPWAWTASVSDTNQLLQGNADKSRDRARPAPRARLIDSLSRQFVSGVDRISLIWGKTRRRGGGQGPALSTRAGHPGPVPAPLRAARPGTHAGTHSATLLAGLGVPACHPHLREAHTNPWQVLPPPQPPM